MLNSRKRAVCIDIITQPVIIPSAEHGSATWSTDVPASRVLGPPCMTVAGPQHTLCRGSRLAKTPLIDAETLGSGMTGWARRSKKKCHCRVSEASNGLGVASLSDRGLID